MCFSNCEFCKGNIAKVITLQYTKLKARVYFWLMNSVFIFHCVKARYARVSSGLWVMCLPLSREFISNPCQMTTLCFTRTKEQYCTVLVFFSESVLHGPLEGKREGGKEEGEKEERKETVSVENEWHLGNPCWCPKQLQSSLMSVQRQSSMEGSCREDKLLFWKILQSTDHR